MIPLVAASNRGSGFWRDRSAGSPLKVMPAASARRRFGCRDNAVTVGKPSSRMRVDDLPWDKHKGGAIRGGHWPAVSRAAIPEGIAMTVTADRAAARKPGGGAARKSSTPSTAASARRPARPAAVEHLSRADRAARGKDARAVAPLESHAEFSAGPGAGSGRAAAGPGGVAGAGAGAGPARADAGVPVHVLPGRGAADGGGPGRHARLGAAGAAVRGRAPVEFRRVRLAGAAAGLRRQRLRRDPARAVRVGRQAAGREPGRGRAGQRLPR